MNSRSTTPAEPPLPVPERVGPVRVTGLLGCGAMGQVFQGVDETLGRPVAVKVLATVQDAEAAERFDREALALARLCHPNVVQVYSKGDFQGRPYFCMELVTGPSVQDLLEQHGPFPPGEAVEIARQVALGLRAAAEAGVTHRDVKPANLLLATDGTVKVADFGVCKIAGRSPGVTEAGTTLGTPFYMAPEQARGEAVDSRADQYALGATLFHLLTGRTPYASLDTMAQLLAHQQQPMPDVRVLAPEVPRRLAQVLSRMVEKDAGDRFPDYNAVVDALEQALLPPAPVHPARWAAWGGALALAGGLALAPLVLGARLDGDMTAALPPPRPRPPVVAPPPPAPPLVSEAPREGLAPADGTAPWRNAPDAVHQDQVDQALLRVAASQGAQRTAALAALARLRDLRVRRTLEAILRDPKDPEAPYAAVLLGGLGDQAATDALVESLRSPRRATVLATVDALVRLRDVRAVGPLGELAERHADPTVRARAKRAGAALFSVEAAH